jgi:ferrous iron transport protein B
VRQDGARELLQWLDGPEARALAAPQLQAPARPGDAREQVLALHQQVARIMAEIFDQ